MITVKKLIKEIGDCQIKGDINNKYIDNLANPYHANVTSLIFINSSRQDRQTLLERTQANVILCDSELELSSISDKCFLVVKNPKQAFVKLSKIFFSNHMERTIHPTAIIHPEAILGENVHIGPYVYIGKCEIKSNVIIHGKCYLYDNVLIGEHTILQAGCIIGADGCGHIKDDEGYYHAFPHIGRVIIESHVEIGTNSCIAKGALSDTVIKRGAIIDSFVQIGHNVVIEERVMILAHAVIGGSSVIKKNTLLAIGAHICDYVTVGENAHIGPGVVVMQNVPDGAKVVSRAPLILPA
jgi:UDP-3-O-[3-hydroxymyristoyl] glucosamine N-acyltransferase